MFIIVALSEDDGSDMFLDTFTVLANLLFTVAISRWSMAVINHNHVPSITRVWFRHILGFGLWLGISHFFMVLAGSAIHFQPPNLIIVDFRSLHDPSKSY